ncbi:esterase family protein [Mechercharimyces sp. CAU 1602]|uniref:alpha/beta hydrolase n=1 Tax=Mechercharimyces sp. CAU 1602 TaxID=2973933 RepID=UPI002161339B|nr:alpha/beta hydrolase-fold protein [Mechercharimyces sp. CAU 1602]MCS1351915.1 alpha/beta hydrolase-fold protein [Mechercharimyces sp. CAU 1602]
MEKEYLKRTIVKREVNSQYLPNSRTIQIYLPPGYDDNSTYPVLYLHDGDDYFNLGRIATQANKMIIDDEIEPIIMVAIPVDKSVRTEEYAPVHERNHAYQQFFAHELLPAVEGEFAIDATPSGRVVGGSSLGGTVSLHLTLEHPHLLRHVLSQSGAFWEPTIDAISQQHSLSDVTIYQTVGMSETAVSTHQGTFDILNRNREVSRLLQDKGCHLYYEEKEGDHTWGFWQKDIPDALRYFFG